MKTVKCIKDTIGFKKGEIFELEGSYIYYKDWADNEMKLMWDEYPEYFQEVTGEPVKKPKWKVGSPVINKNGIAMTISAIDTRECDEDEKYYIDGIEDENGFVGSWINPNDYRDPTPEELELNFK